MGGLLARVGLLWELFGRLLYPLPDCFAAAGEASARNEMRCLQALSIPTKAMQRNVHTRMEADGP